MSTIPENQAVQEFRDYLVDNYISNEGLFPPRIWASVLVVPPLNIVLIKKN